MRRLLPFIMVAVALIAIAVSLPSSITGLSRPGSEPPEPIETRLGLDLQGGLRGEYRAVTEGGGKPSSEAMENIRNIIENRVNSTGVAEPIVQRQGDDRVVVEIPGISDEEAVRRLIGSTGRLDFIPLPPERFGTDQQNGTEPVPAEGDPVPEDPATGAPLPALFSGNALDASKVAAIYDQQQREWGVSFTLLGDAAQKFGEYTSTHKGEFFAIALDEKIVSAPRINEPILGGTGQITGSFTPEEANLFANTLKFGALPHRIEEVGFNSISATLGLDFLKQSILAGIIGIGLVFAFMLVYYRLPGLVACLALVFYMLITYAVFRLVPVTLTLAGVAAFVLSVGMAVDANILIFERTKEELRAGKTINAAIEAGFNRAWNSIIDSNVSSLITAGILYYVGSSVIRGFALVLIIGVLISMFTAIAFSRAILRLVVRQPWARHARFYGVHEEEFTTATAARGGRSRQAGVRV